MLELGEGRQSAGLMPGGMALRTARPRERGVAAGGGVVFAVSLVPGCGWFAGLEDGSQCGALGVGEGWGLSHEVLNMRGEAVRARPW